MAGNKRKPRRVKTHMEPTVEQQAIIDAAVDGQQIVVQALAGTGKTSTLLLVAEALADKKLLYVVYNRKAADEAKVKFAELHLSNAKPSTAHSLAYAFAVKKFGGNRQLQNRLGGGRKPAREVAKAMGAGWLNITPEISLSPVQVARVAKETVKRFCDSADDQIEFGHVPWQNGIIGSNHTKLVGTVLPLARRYWDDVNDVNGRLPFTHDHYLKQWALSSPKLSYDVIMLDEAQDTNPVLADVIRKQADHAQLIIVGDGNQQLYAWRGAVDALATFPGATQLALTQSWRFGQVVADEANRWLAQVGTDLRVTGNPALDSVLAELPEADAVLCRTNAGAMASVMALLATGQKVGLVGGGTSIQRLAEAAIDLQAGKRTSHPELFAFKNWIELVDYVKEEGQDLRPFVKMIEEYGADVVIEATQRLVPENQADVIVSTAHKSKGLEWNRVRIGTDYVVPEEGKEVSKSEAMLNYVAVTRAKLQLDRGALSWIDDLGVTA